MQKNNLLLLYLNLLNYCKNKFSIRFKIMGFIITVICFFKYFKRNKN